jgi:hypothetical protein
VYAIAKHFSLIKFGINPSFNSVCKIILLTKIGDTGANVENHTETGRDEYYCEIDYTPLSPSSQQISMLIHNHIKLYQVHLKVIATYY